MTDLAFQDTDEPIEEHTSPRAPVAAVDVRPVPRISIQAFCDSAELAKVIEGAAADRRMARAHVKVHSGGIVAAAEFYQGAATPNLIIVESKLAPARLDAELDRLSEVCDAGTKVVVIGATNDIRSTGATRYSLTPRWVRPR